MSINNTKKKIKNIIFDLGNTLVFFDHNIFYQGIARHEVFNVNHFKDYILKNKILDKLASGKMTHREAYNILRKEFDLTIGFPEFVKTYQDIFWENTPMKDFLLEISKRNEHDLFLLSNVDKPHIDFVNKNYPYVNILKDRVLSYKARSIKPEGKIYRDLLKTHKIKPEESLFIDDMKENIERAKKFGINSLHYTHHGKFLKDVRKYL